MIAVIILPGPSASLHGLDDRHPAALLPVGDRPILQHIIEHLRDRNVRRFEFILGQSPERVEGHFGGGTRWGCCFRWHLAHDTESAYRLLPIVASDPGERYLLAEAALFPAITLLDANAEEAPLVLAVRLDQSNPGEIAASIWSPNTVDLRFAAAGRDSFYHHLAELDHSGRARWVRTQEFIDARDGLRLLSSQLRVLKYLSEASARPGVESRDGIRTARNVVVHPSAKLTAPVYIGPNSRIGRHVQLGPNTVLARTASSTITRHSATRLFCREPTWAKSSSLRT